MNTSILAVYKKVRSKSTKKLLTHFACFAWIILAGLPLSAQNQREETIKNAGGIMIEQSQNTEISIDESGQLHILAHIYEETDHLGENTSLFGEQSVRYSGSFTEIADLKAYALIPNGKNKTKKITVEEFVTSDSRSAGIFYDDQKEINFLFPALTDGSKTVISYSKKFLEPRLWGYFMFSSFFPVKKSICSVRVPEEVTIKYALFGNEKNKIKFTVSKKGKYNVYTWTAEDLERVSIAKGSDGILHTVPHLVIHVDSYTFQGKEYSVLGDVNDLHDWYQSFTTDLEGEDNPQIKHLVDSITADKIDETKKAEAVYDWVQNNIKYIAIEDGLGGFRPRSPSTVFNRRYGDCKDMSNLIHNMLGLAGIASDLTWIGTTAIPYTHTQVPTPMADNHMICTFTHNGRYYFLDATDPQNTFGVPTTHIQGREAMINKGVKDFELAEVPVVPAQKNYVIDSVYLRIDDDLLLGSGEAVYSGYKKGPVNNNLQNLREKDKKLFLNDLLAKGNNKFILDSVSTAFVYDKRHDTEINYKFTIGDYIGKYEDEIFFNPHLDKALQNAIIDLEKEREDIYYPYKSVSKDIFCFEIPAGFQVNFIPQDVSFMSEDFGAEITYRSSADKIIVRQVVLLNTMRLRKDQFEDWNKMVKLLFAAYKESVVLVKK